MRDTPNARFSGLYVATLTPFDAADRVNFSVLRAHTRFLADAGVPGICPAGTTGEFLYLSVGEKVRVIDEAAAAARGRMKVIAGIWGLRPGEVKLLARSAEAAGADAVFLPPPIYYPLSDDAIYRWYAAVRDICDIPIFAYNIPGYAVNSVSLECAARLAEDGVITGIKDSMGKAERMQALVDRLGSRTVVMAASDSFATQGRQIGAQGFISAIANIWPVSFRRLWEGDAAIQPAVDAVRKAVKESGGIPALKYLASLRGFAFGAARIPYSALTDAQKAALDAVYADARLE